MAVARVLPFVSPSEPEPPPRLTPDEARRLLNRHAGFEKYTPEEAARLLGVARLIAGALVSPQPFRR